jgi:hypothetical protein
MRPNNERRAVPRKGGGKMPEEISELQDLEEEEVQEPEQSEEVADKSIISTVC